MRPIRPKEEQIVVWIGVIAQLVETRSNRVLAETDLPYPQFVLLLHFCHDPERECTVSSLARAFQTNQPRISKTVKKLIARGYLQAIPDSSDSRVKNLRVTARGVKAHNRAINRIAPDLSGVFQGWKQSDISDLHRHLERLKTTLDETRTAKRR